eukprot:TRINITY_DN60634_c0_g1_i1.p1 TRINITY_DN60634_c0_g1~~TRINITY_DN60634_c0_g1_i1.p1  ORF type:complete len:211 (+),score=44.38 TRINITY_DN60634_c0_g1_i1:57-689(+)
MRVDGPIFIVALLAGFAVAMAAGFVAYAAVSRWKKRKNVPLVEDLESVQPAESLVTREVVLEGDYDALVSDKVLFLEECSTLLHPVRCVDVRPGSIIVALAATRHEELEEAEARLAAEGLELPTFGRLTMQVADKEAQSSEAAVDTTPQDAALASPEEKEMVSRSVSALILDTYRSMESHHNRVIETCEVEISCGSFSAAWQHSGQVSRV